MDRQENPGIVNQIRNNLEDIGERVQSGIAPVIANANNGVESISRSIENTKDSVNSVLDDFSSKNSVDAGSDFLNSNSIIAKFAFILLVLILFVFLFNLGVRLITYFTSPSKSPYIVKGLITGSAGVVITQDPNSETSITIQRSNNYETGIEFTWSVWLYVTNTNAKEYSHVFNKGDSKWNSNGISSVNNGPGLYLKNTPTTSTTSTTGSSKEIGLYIVMDTGNVENTETNKSKEVMEIKSIPLQKWFNVCICLKNVIMDVYVNGVNSGRHIMPYVPRQNYNDINVCQNGGFEGNLSDLRYFDHALSIYEINGLIWKGPNLTQNSSVSNGTTYSKGTNYVSNLWYTSKWN